MEHTKLPWKYCGQEREKPEVCGCMQIWSKPDDHPVAKVECGKWGDEYPSIRFTKDSCSLLPKIEPYMDIIEYGFINQETAKANAAFIVLACNSHYELLEACKEALEYLPAKDGQTTGEPDGDIQLIICNQLKAAILEAEGKK
jgi:hypothetical protein